MEYFGLGAVTIGSLIGLIGWIWLIIIGFKQGGVLWAIFILLFSGIAGLIFCIVYKTGWVPLLLLVVGGLISGLGMVPTILRQL